MTGLREQLAQAYDEMAPSPESLARMRARLEEVRRRSHRVRTRLAVGLLTAAAASGWCVLAWHVARDERAPAASFRVTATSMGAIDGVPATFLSLEDAMGRRYHLVQADLPEGSRPEAIEVALDGATYRVSSGDGVLVGLAVPRGRGLESAVRRPRSLVSAGGESLSPVPEVPMNDSSTRAASSRLTRAALLALASLSVTTPALPEPAPSGPTAVQQGATPALYAVKVHADWCPACRKVGTVFDDLARRLADQPVMFVELDITSTATLKQSEYLAAALRLDEAWGDRRAAGYVLLVDGPTRRVVGRMNLDLGLDELARRTRDAL